MAIINFLRKSFEINTKMVVASDLALKPPHYEKSEKFKASENIVVRCKAVKADVYFAGPGAKAYLNLEPFKREGIKVRFQDYYHPVYKQCYPCFVPNMAAIDALFCVGTMPQADFCEMINEVH